MKRIPHSQCVAGVMAAALLLVLPVAAGAAGSEEEQREAIQRLIVQEAVGNSVVPPPLALAVARESSDFAARVVGTSGAIGVMQLLPETAAQEFGVGADELWDLTTNVRLGLHYLSRLYWRYDQNWELALSHYRGGSLQQDSGRFRPHEYTRDYVQQVLLWWRRYRNDPVVRGWMRELYGGPRFRGRGRFDPSGSPGFSDESAPERFQWTGSTWTAVAGDRFR